MRIDVEKTRWQCDYCGGVEVPNPDADGVALLGGSTGLECPVCHVQLVHAAVRNVPLFACPVCRGVLVEIATFQGLILEMRANYDSPALPGKPIQPKDLERRIQCPRCHQPMDTHPYAGGGCVVIDNCPDCACNWLDYGDLHRIVNGAGSPGAARC